MTILLRVIVGVASVILLGILAIAICLWTQPGRDMITPWVERGVSSALPGSFECESIEAIGLGRPVVTEASFFTPDGQRVLYVKRASADISLSAMLAGTLAFNQARADGGEVLIEILDDGTTTLESALKKRQQPNDPLPLELHDMHFEDMTSTLRLSGEDRFIVRDLEGFVSVWRRDTPGVRVALSNVQGSFEKPEILGNTIELRDLDAEVWAQEAHVVSMQLKTAIGDGKIDVQFDFYDREENPATLTLRPEVGSGAAITTHVLEVRSWFSDKMSVTVE